MHPSKFPHLLQHSPLFPPPAAPLCPQSPYRLPAEIPAYPNCGYNTHWGLEQEQVLLHNANKMTVAGPSAAGVVSTANNDGCQCKWSPGGIPCNQVLADFDGLMGHVGHAHGVQGPAARKLVCQWMTDRGSCGKEYRRDGFRRHVGTHVGLSVPCTECGKSFSRSDSMRAHVKKDHSKE
ncbi:hypothetical protein HD554DRAFT_2078125 [Boletus coccyginus]|nr:hypothetical protein HD554DRAFT_2078125 [Boletus coccyginus]